MKILIIVFLLIKQLLINNTINSNIYSENINSYKTVEDIPLPKDFKRIKYQKYSFASWLRKLPLKTIGSPVLLHNGRLKTNQHAHYAVIKMSVGKRNLQQCADAIMRLKAEYLYRKHYFSKIKFNLTSGDPFPFVKWASTPLGFSLSTSSTVCSALRTSPFIKYTFARAFLA